jgi:hypothetical protein
MGEATEITGDLTPLGTTAMAFGQRVDASPAGVPLSWNDLSALADAIDYTVWGTFLGCGKRADFAGLAALFLDDYRYLDRTAPEFYETVEIAFQAVDGWFWLVYARDNALRETIRNAFDDVEVVPTK